jgi:hypothetical protein
MRSNLTENQDQKPLRLRHTTATRLMGCAIFGLSTFTFCLTATNAEQPLHTWYWFIVQATGTVFGTIGGRIGKWGAGTNSRLILMGVFWLALALPAQFATKSILGADGAQAYLIGVVCSWLIFAPRGRLDSQEGE